MNEITQEKCCIRGNASEVGMRCFTLYCAAEQKGVSSRVLAPDSHVLEKESFHVTLNERF